MEIIVLAPKFERLWKDSTIEQQQQACRYINDGSLGLLRKWVQEHPSIELGEMNIRQLRERARKAGVRNYSRKDKSELIIEIQFKESKSGKEKINTNRGNQIMGAETTAHDRLNRDEKEFLAGAHGRPFVPG